MLLDDAIAQRLFECDADDIAESARQREDFVARFPPEMWTDMPIERYALGTEDSKASLSYALEWGTPRTGSIRGGSAEKFGVYFKQKEGEWYFPKTFRSVDEAWAAIRSGFQKAVQHAQRGEWSEVDGVHIPVWPGVRGKVLSSYFPDDLLPINAQEHLKNFAERLGIDAPTGVIALNRRILALLRSQPRLAELTGDELSRFLYSWASPGRTGRDSRATVYLKVSPGVRAEAWEECLREGYICVGWNEVGDLSLYDTVDELIQAFSEHYPADTARQWRLNAGNLWRFRNLEPGDCIVANRGISEILGVGTVLEAGYNYLPERSSYHHTVAVEWDTSVSGVLDPGFGGWRGTFQKLKPKDVERILALASDTGASRMDDNRPELRWTSDEIAQFRDWARAVDRKKQLILYGPPGTGKTHQARRFAEWYIEQQGQSHASAIMAVTFHASYSYEEFVEGYRPVNSNAEGLRLELRDGVMKQFCSAASNDPDQTFIMLIDEINRANVPRVFGELLTVIEADKRGSSVLLPGSQEHLVVPPNLLVIATMNTADRSIRTLDSALRRRFTFCELMPDSRVLEGGQIDVAGGLSISAFLDELNARITAKAGRERQVGHSFFLNDGEPISDTAEFAQVIRLEIIPLLQEIAYDDYTQLGEFLGADLVDTAASRLRSISSDEKLVELLAVEYGAEAAQDEQ